MEKIIHFNKFRIRIWRGVDILAVLILTSIVTSSTRFHHSVQQKGVFSIKTPMKVTL